MGTKQNPGRFDCYDKAHADEPIFTLRAKDPNAPAIVEAWAANARMLIELGTRPPSDIAKVEEALDCARAMRIWRRDFTIGAHQSFAAQQEEDGA